jgi:hypothetical protein
MHRLALLPMLALLLAGCGGRVLAVSEPRTTYVVKQGFMSSYVLHCTAQEGSNPDPVCTEVKEVD